MHYTWVGWRRRYFLTLPCQYRVIFFPVIVGIKKLLKPLKELKVVLKLPLHQSLHRDDLRDREGGGEGGGQRDKVWRINFTELS